MVLAPIGKSRYGQLVGVRQYLGTQVAANHFNSAAYEFDHDARRKGNGRRLVANEGFRDEDRCLLLYKQYRDRGWAPPKVAAPLTSNHYVGARAVDVGIITKDGVYDVPTDAEFSEIHAHLAAHGFYWAGQNFGEAWHHEYVGGGPKPIIPGVNQAGDPYYDKSEPNTTPVKKRHRDEDDMQVNWNNKHTAALITAGSKHVTLDSTTPKRSGLTWQKQVTLCERHAAIDPSKSYPGGMLDAELAVIRAVLNSMRN